jgi:hypothetical protein
MIRLLIILQILTLPIISKCQDFQFSPTGKMEVSNFLIDTVLQTDYKKYLNNVEFSKIDSLKLNALRAESQLKQIIYQRLFSNDSTEYFYLYNSTYKDIKLKRLNNKIVTVEIARNANGGFQPMSFFIYPKCGTGINYTDFVLKTGQILIIKNNTPKTVGHFLTMAKVKIKTSTNGILISTEFPISLDTNSFTVKSDFKNDINYSKRQITLLGR